MGGWMGGRRLTRPPPLNLNVRWSRDQPAAPRPTNRTVLRSTVLHSDAETQRPAQRAPGTLPSLAHPPGRWWRRRAPPAGCAWWAPAPSTPTQPGCAAGPGSGSPERGRRRPPREALLNRKDTAEVRFKGQAHARDEPGQRQGGLVSSSPRRTTRRGLGLGSAGRWTLTRGADLLQVGAHGSTRGHLARRLAKRLHLSL